MELLPQEVEEAKVWKSNSSGLQPIQNSDVLKIAASTGLGWFNGYKVVYERSGGDLERAELPIHFPAAFWGHHLHRFSLSCFIYCFLVGHWCYQSQKCELPQCEGTAKQFPFPITLVILLLCKRAAERNNTKNSQHSAFNASCSHYLWPFQCQTGYFEALGVCGNCSFCVDQG